MRVIDGFVLRGFEQKLQRVVVRYVAFYLDIYIGEQGGYIFGWRLGLSSGLCG